MKKFLFFFIIIVAVGGYFWYQGATQPLDKVGQDIQGLLSGDKFQQTLSGISQSGTNIITTTRDKIMQVVQKFTNKETPPPSDTTMCTMDYTPVCGEVQVQCIKAPCPPVKQTFGNRCTLNANTLAKFLYNGECSDEETMPVDLSSCSSYFDGCNTCTVKDGKLGGCTKKYCQTPEAPKCLQTNSVGIANPASVNCEKEGGDLQIQTTKEGSQIGMCIFPEGNQCEEWALYRGECSK